MTLIRLRYRLVLRNQLRQRNYLSYCNLPWQVALILYFNSCVSVQKLWLTIKFVSYRRIIYCKYLFLRCEKRFIKGKINSNKKNGQICIPNNTLNKLYFYLPMYVYYLAFKYDNEKCYLILWINKIKTWNETLEIKLLIS